MAGRPGPRNILPGHGYNRKVNAPAGTRRAMCECGETSPYLYHSARQREMWIQRHREEIAEEPWTDAGIAKEKEGGNK